MMAVVIALSFLCSVLAMALLVCLRFLAQQAAILNVACRQLIEVTAQRDAAVNALNATHGRLH